jgi:thiol:disulfide interchange protein DsbG
MRPATLCQRLVIGKMRPRSLPDKEFPLRKLVTALLCLLSVNSSSAGNWVQTPDRVNAGMMQRLEGAHWIASGARSSARVVYVFSDPNCPYCNDLWKALKTARAPDVQIRYLLVAVIDADSRGKDAAILESADPAATLEAQETKFDTGGIASKATWQPATAATLSSNEALMDALHIYGTPGIVYVDQNGQTKVFAGMPDPAQLRAIFGKR